MRRIAGLRVALVASVLLATASLAAVQVAPAAMAAAPAAPAAPAATAATVVNVPGAPSGDVVTDGHGYGYVTNPTQNRVEVLNLATATLEAPIVVGRSPADST